LTDDLLALVDRELAAPVAAEAGAFAARLAALGRRPPLGVLFYGSSLRTGDLDGILDFYVVTERLADWRHGRLAARANALLPPNVEYHEAAVGDRTIRSKVAILSLSQFRRLASPASLDTTVWARFSQPAAIAWSRDAAARAALAEAVAGAVATGASWARRLAPPGTAPADCWRLLFRRTYAAELRVEDESRPDAIVAVDPARYERMFEAARVRDTRPELADPERGWRRRARVAKPLNLARLAKAAFTFRGGADYLAWKVSRHTGEEIRLTERQRRHPALAFAAISRRLWRRRRRAG
jgi:hypothetical protein